MTTTFNPNGERLFVCGTRAVVKHALGFRVVCATCGQRGSTLYPSLDAAQSAAVKQSTRACQVKGCGAR